MRLAVALLLTFLLQFVWIAPAQEPLPVQKAQQFFRLAEKYYDTPEPTEITDSLALDCYLQAAALFPRTAEFADELFECYFMSGTMEQTYLLQPEALLHYQDARAIVHQFDLPDSLLFKPYLFSGNAHYFLNHFDSAIHFFELAEVVLHNYQELEDGERLYNSLGAVYFQSGNFTQSVNYFQRAFQISMQNAPDDTIAYYSFQSNIASALRRLEHFDSAAFIYKQLLPLGIQTEKLTINIASIYLDLNQPDSALHFLKTISKPQEVDPVTYYNQLGYAWYLKNEPDQAKIFLAEAQRNSGISARNIKSMELGKTYRLLGKIEQQEKHFSKALKYYQQSMVAFEYEFNDTSIFVNPSEFERGFTSYELFETLYAKASCYEAWCHETSDTGTLRLALQCYESTYSLADFIRTSFDNEEARLFFNKKVLAVYQAGIALLIEQFETTENDRYLYTAFDWASKSKARALSIQIRENEIKKFAGIPDTLLYRERDLKLQLSNLMQQTNQVTDSSTGAELQASITTCRFELSRLLDRLNEYPSYYKLKHGQDSLDFSGLQAWLGDQDQLLLSYFHTPLKVYVFGVTGSNLRLHQLLNDSVYQYHLTHLHTALHEVIPGAGYAGTEHASWLYSNLLEPLLDKTDIRSLVIIPHESLNGIPFEVLENKDQEYLIQHYPVVYQYSTFFLEPGKPAFKFEAEKALAVAPFLNPPQFPNGYHYQQLPSSGDEVKQLKGIQLLNEEATKRNFLSGLKDARMAHLATHSMADLDDPLHSFIAFYPYQSEDTSYKLFAHEIYNLNLQDISMVVLSSCETGSGKSATGEGILSLSRAFASAGCDNQLISLWKAEDQPTAYISQHFYKYLEAGEDLAAALQRARLDLLNDPAMAQYRAPPFWSNLVLIGTSSQVNGWWSRNFWLIGMILIIAIGALILISKRFRLKIYTTSANSLT